MTDTDPPMVGERWTDHPSLPHGTREQIVAWLLAGWNPRRLFVVTHCFEDGMVSYARCVSSSGALGLEYQMERDEFTRSFQRVPDAAPDPQDVPPERPR